MNGNLTALVRRMSNMLRGLKDLRVWMAGRPVRWLRAALCPLYRATFQAFIMFYSRILSPVTEIVKQVTGSSHGNWTAGAILVAKALTQPGNAEYSAIKANKNVWGFYIFTGSSQRWAEVINWAAVAGKSLQCAVTQNEPNPEYPSSLTVSATNQYLPVLAKRLSSVFPGKWALIPTLVCKLVSNKSMFNSSFLLI